MLSEGYGLPPKEGTWGDQFRREINGNYNPRKFISSGLLITLATSTCYKKAGPRIPDNCICAQLEPAGSNELWLRRGILTAPIQEVIRHKENALLSDFLTQNICRNRMPHWKIDN